MSAGKNKNLEHHAYLLESDGGLSLDELKKIVVEKFSLGGAGHEWFLKSFETFGIEDSRALKEMQSRKSNPEELKIFILKTSFFTGEAQNALLKVFEEPTEGTRIFLVAPKSAGILPTLRSRLFNLGGVNSSGGGDDESAMKFLSGSAPERLKIIKKMAENKDKASAAALLNALEKILGGEIATNLSREEIFVLEEVRKGREYLFGRAPSIKMILEHISLITPVKKIAL